MTKKIDNCKLTMLKYIWHELQALVPDLDKIWMNKYFNASIRRPSWNAKCGKNQIKIGGIDIHVHAQCINGYQTSREIRFGVRTDKDGAIDIQKLADKINDRRSEIEEILELAKSNEDERERRRRASRDNGDVLDRLVEEGLLKHAWEITECHDGFHAEIRLNDEDELRAFLAFRAQLIATREIEA